MLLELKTVKNTKLEKDYQKMMSELNEFYDINWIHHTPDVIFVDSREQIDSYWGKKTNPYIVGWINSSNRTVYVLKNEKMESESAHKKHTEEKYNALIKHELSHSFTKIESGDADWIPKWLWEGISIYASGDLSFKKRIEKFETFLEYYNDGFADGVYKESGFVVELLVNRFGKEKLLTLIKNLKNYQSKDKFELAFKKLYGFKPNYKKFNLLLNETKNK